MLIHGEKVLNREVKWKLNGVKEGQREQDSDSFPWLFTDLIKCYGMMVMVHK